MHGTRWSESHVSFVLMFLWWSRTHATPSHWDGVACILQYKSSLGALRVTLSIRECCPFFMRVMIFRLVKYRFDDGPIETENIGLRWWPIRDSRKSRTPNVISLCVASAMTLGYYPSSDAVVVDSKWGDDKEGSLFGGFRQRPFDFRSLFWQKNLRLLLN